MSNKSYGKSGDADDDGAALIFFLILQKPVEF